MSADPMPALPDANPRHRQLCKLQSLTTMATGIAHDFNNHLAAILGNNNVILRAVPTEGRVRDCVQRIEAAANLALQLSDQLTLYASRVACESSAIDWRHLLEEVRGSITPTRSGGLQVEYQTAPDTPALMADADLLRRALINLITNSAESMIERTGGIRVAVGPFNRKASDAENAFFELGATPRWVAITVSDDGCGFAAQSRALIFDPFYSTKIRGRGMGLPEVLGIARLHGGNVVVESQPGVGTQVKLLLPPEPPTA